MNRFDVESLTLTSELTAKTLLSQKRFSLLLPPWPHPPSDTGYRLQRSAQCWGDSLNLLLTLNAPQMSDATVALTTQDVPGSWSELCCAGFRNSLLLLGLKGEERSDGQRGEVRLQ